MILKANRKALEAGSKVDVLTLQKPFPTILISSYLFMSYANILFRQGYGKFAERMKNIGLTEAIVPDLPTEEGHDYMSAMKENRLDPIFIFSPETNDKRLSYLASHASGFVCWQARKGVTGNQTKFSDDLSQYFKRCRNTSDLTLAIRFGAKDKTEADYLKGKSDIAVIGSQTTRIVEQQDANAVRKFIRSVT